jgi:hypothetical protein
MKRKHRGPIRPTVIAWCIFGCMIFWTIIAYYLIW